MGNVGEGAKGTTNGGAEVSETPEMAPEAVAGGRWMVRTQVLVDCMRVLHSVSGRECVQFDVMVWMEWDVTFLKGIGVVMVVGDAVLGAEYSSWGV